MITCYTCKLKFKTFSDMIKHRREQHPSQRKCKNFPNCVWKEKCLYMHVLHRQEEGLAEDSMFTCITCKNNFSDKNEMMIHRKIEHVDEVKDCKDIETNNCRKGPQHCWYRHDRLQTNSNSRSTTNNTTRAPSYTQQDFPNLPTTTHKNVVGQVNMEQQQLQMIQQTLQQQQQQMTLIMSEIMKLKN